MTVPTTVVGRATRARMLESAAALMRTQGATAVTLNDVLRASKTSKSQLFHYFPSGRAELAREVVRFEIDRFEVAQAPYLKDLSTWKAWWAWRDALVTYHREDRDGSGFTVLVAQLGPSDPEILALGAAAMSRLQEGIELGIWAMARRSKVRKGVEPSRAAAAIVAGIQGGVIAAYTTGKLRHLEAVLDDGIRTLRRRAA